MSRGRRTREARAARRRWRRRPAAQRPCTRPRACACGDFRAPARTSPERPRARDVGAGGNGGGGDAREAGRRSDAGGGRCDARSGACERGAATRQQQPQAGWSASSRSRGGCVPSGLPERWPPPPPDGRQRRRTRARRKQCRTAAPTAWEQPSGTSEPFVVSLHLACVLSTALEEVGGVVVEQRARTRRRVVARTQRQAEVAAAVRVQPLQRPPGSPSKRSFRAEISSEGVQPGLRAGDLDTT